MTASFSSPDELRDEVTRALHHLELSRQAGVADEAEMTTRADALIPAAYGLPGPTLALIVTGGPRQQILRPSDLEDRDLQRFLMQEALFGNAPVMDPRQGTEARVEEHAVTVEQRDSSLLIDDLGSIRIVQPTGRLSGRALAELPTLIEEDLRDLIARSIGFAAIILDKIDPLARVSDVVPAIALQRANYLGWQSRAEHAQSPSSVSIHMRASDNEVVKLSPARRHRAALTHDADRLTADFITVLRRRFRG